MHFTRHIAKHVLPAVSLTIMVEYLREELLSKVQKEVDRIMPMVNESNLTDLADLDGYRHDFLATSGFDVSGVDYEADIARFDTISKA